MFVLFGSRYCEHNKMLNTVLSAPKDNDSIMAAAHVLLYTGNCCQREVKAVAVCRARFTGDSLTLTWQRIDKDRTLNKRTDLFTLSCRLTFMNTDFPVVEPIRKKQ